MYRKEQRKNTKERKDGIDPNNPVQVEELESIKKLYPYAEKTCRFVVDKEAAASDMMAVIADNFIGPDNADITRTDSLTNFIYWAAKTCLARKYILILADHGDGYLPNEELPAVNAVAARQNRVVIKDDGHNRKAFNAKTLTHAINQASVRLSAVYCDACLMNTVEYQFELAPVTDYLVLSTILVPSAGGNYTELVNAISANPDNLDDALVRFVKFCVDAWDKDAEIEDKGENNPHYHDMSVYRTAYIDAFGAELKTFVDRLIDTYQNGGDEVRIKIDDITANAYRVDDEQPTFDLMHYIFGITTALPDVFGTTLVNIAENAFGNYFLHQQSSKWLENNGHTVSLSVLLGCQGHFIITKQGKSILYDADGLSYLLQDGERIGKGSSWGSTLDATYGQLRFDKITGWSRWLKLNQQEPNTKCYVEYRDF